ncbi:MAG: hypothetical protein QW416_09020 [Candidatus Nitrosocaldaceae archaeon]
MNTNKSILLAERIGKRANLIISIIMGIGLISGLYLAHIKYFSAFTALDISPVNYSDLGFPLSNDKFMYVKIDDVIGHIFIFMIFSRITDLAVEEMMFLPIGSIILPLGYFIFARRFLQHYYNGRITFFITIILATYIIFDTYTGTSYYSIFKYVFTYFLFFLFLSLYMTRSDKNNERMIAMVLIFIAMSMIHYTVSFLAMIIVIVEYFIGMNRRNSIGSMSFMLVLVSIFIISNLQVIGSYFTDWDVGGEDKITKALNAIQSYIYGGVEEGYITYEHLNHLTTVLKSVRALIISLPVIIYFAIYLTKYKIRPLDGLLASILIASIMHPLLYVNIGSISINSPTQIFMLPLISVILLNFIRVREDKVMLYVLFLLVVVVLAYIPQLYDINYSDLYNSIMVDRSYIIDKMDLGGEFSTNRVLSDLRVRSLYILESVKQDKSMVPLDLSNETYASLVNNSNDYKRSYRYAILPLNNKPMLTGWDTYKPTNMYINDINSNPYLNKIDHIGVIVIYYNIRI